MRLKVILFFRSVFFYAMFLLIGTAMTGKTEREYAVVPADANLTVQGKEYSVESLAARYRPVVYAPENHPNKPIGIRYEVVDDAECYALIYHFEWDRAEHPSFLTNLGRQLIKFAYYNLTTRHSEYVQVRVNKNSNVVENAQFRSLSKHVDYFETSVSPLTARIYRQPANREVEYLLQKRADDAELLEEQQLALSGERLALRVVHWGNFLDWQHSEGESGWLAQDFGELQWLDSKTYRNEKFARRPQGEWRSEETPANFPVMIFVSFIFTGYLVALQWGYANRKVTQSLDPEYTGPKFRKKKRDNPNGRQKTQE